MADFAPTELVNPTLQWAINISPLTELLFKQLFGLYKLSFRFRLAFASIPASPVPNNNIVAGSGTGVTKPGAEIVKVY